MSTNPPPILGLDVARALAVIGMILVNFKLVLGGDGAPWLKALAGVLDGKAAATFVVLAGVGLALMTQSAVAANDSAKLRRATGRIVRRALFLFVVGLSYLWLWPADILHFYGVYMLITLLFIRARPGGILAGAGGLILLFPLLMTLWDYTTGWDFVTLEYADFWRPEGFLRNLWFNGFHPVIPWTAFMLVGLWLGRQDLREDRFVPRVLRWSLGGFLMVQVVSWLAVQVLLSGPRLPAEEALALAGTAPMPPMPLYMLNGIFTALTVIAACILLARKFATTFWINALHHTGQLALTFYVAHVLLGMGLVESLGSTALGQYSLAFSLAYATLFSLACVGFAVVWRKHHEHGPLEWAMRKITG